MTDPLPIRPRSGPVDAVIDVPGSKSITNRALVLAALADGQSELHGALESDDTLHMAGGLRALGISVAGTAPELVIQGARGTIPAEWADVFAGNSGTTVRFLTAVASLGRGRYRVDGNQRMRQRPIEDLLAALRLLGVNARSELGTGCPPVVVETDGSAGGHTRLRGNASSQYLSALLMTGPATREGLDIQIEGELVSRPYADMTVAMMRHWGAEARCRGARWIAPGGQRYRAQAYQIEPDASSASYFFAAAAVTGGRVRVLRLGRESLQGDTAFVDVLARMGCDVEVSGGFIEVRGPGRLRGVDADMNGISDTVMTLAAIAPFAESPTFIRNVAHIRHKETDRLAALAAELRRIGVRIEEREDGLTIHPAARVLPAEIETYDDHRMAMSFAIAGLVAPGIAIKDPGCVAKTFPDFFTRLEQLR